VSNIPKIVTSDNYFITFPVYKRLQTIAFGDKLSAEQMVALVALLQQVHNKNIFHRDLRPENILLDGNNVVLIDWGYSVNGQTEGPAGTASFCAKEYALMWLKLHELPDYYPQYDCESLLKCFYYMKDVDLRTKLQNISRFEITKRLELAIAVWESVNDDAFCTCLENIRMTKEDVFMDDNEMYHALLTYINNTHN